MVGYHNFIPIRKSFVMVVFKKGWHVLGKDFKAIAWVVYSVGMTENCEQSYVLLSITTTQMIACRSNKFIPFKCFKLVHVQ